MRNWEERNKRKISHERYYNPRGRRERSKPTIALAYSDKMLKNIHAQCYRNKKKRNRWKQVSPKQ